METTDLITSFFSNEMNPEQERTFLLSVAASDSMRLGLKSHVMIDRILLKQADAIRVPEGLRQNIFAEAGVVAAMPDRTAPETPAVVSRGTFYSRSLRVVSSVLLFAGGATAGYFVHPSDEKLANTPAVSQSSTTVLLKAPQVQSPSDAVAIEAAAVTGDQANAPGTRKSVGSIAGTTTQGTDRLGNGDPRRANPLDPTRRYSRIPNPLNPTKKYNSKGASDASARVDTGGSGSMPSVNALGDISKSDKKKNDSVQSDQKVIR